MKWDREATAHLTNTSGVSMLNTCGPLQMEHTCHIYCTHLAHIFPLQQTIERHEHVVIQTNMYPYCQTISHLFNMWDVRTWTTCVTHQMGHTCHIFSTHLSHIFCCNRSKQSDEHGPILGDYITSLQHVRCSYMAHMCDTSDGTYMPHIYNTYCTHLLL